MLECGALVRGAACVRADQPGDRVAADERRRGKHPARWHFEHRLGEKRAAAERERADAACVERNAAYAARDAARGEVEEYAESYSYRVGSMLLTLPRKAREDLARATKREKQPRD